MRILHLDAGREMRGGQWQVLRLLEGLEKAGVESLLLARPGAPLFEHARECGLRVRPWSFVRALSCVRHCHLIHAHDARSHTVAAFLPGAPLVVARRVAFPIHSRWKYRRAARYIAVSEFVRSVLAAGGIPPTLIDVVPDGVPLLALASGTVILAPANQSDPAKGASLALEAAALAEVPLEFTSDLERDLHRASVFLYLTHSEGLGSAVLLAMSAGVPVIASNIGGLPEIIQHRSNGWLVENAPDAIAEALRELTNNPDFARQLGQTGRKTIEERFTSEQMVTRTMEVYRQVLA
jgi:glycosyltransferase involved in cell wall biosynthesis